MNAPQDGRRSPPPHHGLHRLASTHAPVPPAAIAAASAERRLASARAASAGTVPKVPYCMGTQRALKASSAKAVGPPEHPNFCRGGSASGSCSRSQQDRDAKGQSRDIPRATTKHLRRGRPKWHLLQREKLGSGSRGTNGPDLVAARLGEPRRPGRADGDAGQSRRNDTAWLVQSRRRRIRRGDSARRQDLPAEQQGSCMADASVIEMD